MSLPLFSESSPPLTRSDAINVILASVALEELGVGHLFSAESEKIKFILSLLPSILGGGDVKNTKLNNFLGLNENTLKTISGTIQNYKMFKSLFTALFKSSDAQKKIESVDYVEKEEKQPGAEEFFGEIMKLFNSEGTSDTDKNSSASFDVSTDVVNKDISMEMVCAEDITLPDGSTTTHTNTHPASAKNTAGTTGEEAGAKENHGAFGLRPVEISVFASNTTGSLIPLVMSGTNILLPDSHILSDDVNVNKDNTEFIIKSAGLYRISYQINTTVPLQLGSRVMLNGVPLPEFVIEPDAARSNYYCEVVADIAVGTAVSLQVYSPHIVGAATLHDNSCGALLMITKLS
jgi:hypothetical protein